MTSQLIQFEAPLMGTFNYLIINTDTNYMFIVTFYMCLSPIITFIHFIFPVNTFSFCIEQMLVYHVYTCSNSLQEQEIYCHATIIKKDCHYVTPVRQYGISDFQAFAFPPNACR